MSNDVWSRQALTASGFVGWIPWSDCPGALRQIPADAGGVYVVYTRGSGSPEIPRGVPGRDLAR